MAVPEHDAGAPVAGQLVEGRDAGAQELQRQCLRFVKNDDAVGDVVQFAAARRTVREQALEELHRGGDDDRGVPFSIARDSFCFASLSLIRSSSKVL